MAKSIKKNPQTQPRAEKTRALILKAATALFCKHGYAGTKILAIAKKACINHSLIFHHFDNKKTLWVAVKQHIETDHQKKTCIIPSLSLAWPEFIDELVANSIDFYQQSKILHLIHWQRIEGRGKTLSTLPASTGRSTWLNAIGHYQKTKAINPALAPEHIMRLICSITSTAAWDDNAFAQNKSEQTAYRTFCVQAITHALS